MDVLRITLYEQPALSPLVGISFIVLLNTPYKWIICSDICCMQISGFDYPYLYVVIVTNHSVMIRQQCVYQ
jgi:hypothetical protein